MYLLFSAGILQTLAYSSAIRGVWPFHRSLQPHVYRFVEVSKAIVCTNETIPMEKQCFFDPPTIVTKTSRNGLQLPFFHRPFYRMRLFSILQILFGGICSRLGTITTFSLNIYAP